MFEVWIQTFMKDIINNITYIFLKHSLKKLYKKTKHWEVCFTSAFITCVVSLKYVIYFAPENACGIWENCLVISKDAKAFIFTKLSLNVPIKQNAS